MTLSSLSCRAFQRGFALGARLLPWRTPTVLAGAGSLMQLPGVFAREGASHPLVVASRRLCADERFLALRRALEGRGVRLSVYSGVESNPSVDTVERIAAQYRTDRCDSFLVLGGGSPIDAAKAAAARIVRPDRTLAQLGGLMRVRHTLPLFIAVPTTAGTGSEATIAAVITDGAHRKYAISDLCLIPRYAVLDPTLTLSLPPAITAQTGMDALTHAIEAYLSRYYSTQETRDLAESAVRDIFRYLPVACCDGQSLTARERLLRASFDAGRAFTRASVGNVHAAAHAIGGVYGTPHGLACAVTLPVVLSNYGERVFPQLAQLGTIIGLTGSERERAQGFLAAVCSLNASLGIPDRLSFLRPEDFPRMAAWATTEANPLYPVPVVYDAAHFCRIFAQLRAPRERVNTLPGT